MIWCMLDNNRAQTKEGYTVNKIGPTREGYSYMVIRPNGRVIAWIGADVSGGRKMAVRACMDDMVIQR